MPRFHVKDTFEIPDRKLFVLAGSIVEGVIRPGMFVRVPLGSGIGMRLLIDSIEFARQKGGEDVCLCIWAGPKMAESLRDLDIAGKTFEVAAEPSD